MTPYFAPILTFLGGLLIAYLTAVLKFRKDLEAEYDKTLRAKRMAAYEKLWSYTQPLALYGRPEPVTAEVLAKLATTLRKWYFEEGGLYLTERSKKAYFAFQDGIVKAGKPSEPLEGPGFETLQRLSSRLRTSLANDVGARMEGRVTGA